jgi:hypothetical protein
MKQQIDDTYEYCAKLKSARPKIDIVNGKFVKVYGEGDQTGDILIDKVMLSIQASKPDDTNTRN